MSRASRRSVVRPPGWRRSIPGRRRQAVTWFSVLGGLVLLAGLGAAGACGGGEPIEVRQTVPYGRDRVPGAAPVEPVIPSPLATAPAAESFGREVLLYRLGESPCAILRAGLDGLAAGLCGEELTPRVYLRPDRPLRLAELVSRYAPFELEEGVEKIAFHGRGTEVAGETERRMMLEWARRLLAEARGETTTRAYRLAFEWHRQIQSGRDCEAVTVYLSGEAIATTCDGLRAGGEIPAGQMAAVLAWHEQLEPFQAVRQGRVGGDTTSSRLIVPGAGDVTHGDETVAAMVAFAESLHRDILAADLGRRQAEEESLAALDGAAPEAPEGGEAARAPTPSPAPEALTPEAEAGEITLSEAIAVGADPEEVEEEAEPLLQEPEPVPAEPEPPEEDDAEVEPPPPPPPTDPSPEEPDETDPPAQAR